MAAADSDIPAWEETVRRLYSLIHARRPAKGGGQTDNVVVMRHCMERLALDVSSLKIVHIAGTNGKGSTSSMTESILRSAGLRTGLYTSPHLVDPRGRVRLDGRMVSKRLFRRHFWSILRRLEASADEAEAANMPIVPGFFCFMTLVAFHVFLEAAPDVIVLEVGLGGRLDATNVCIPAVCGITSLDLDHTALLGPTLTHIAREKGGIFKRGVPAFTVPQVEEAAASLQATAEAAGVELRQTRSLESVLPGASGSLGLLGPYQAENAAMAVELARSILAVKDSASGDDLPSAFRTGLTDARWYGRCQRLQHEGETTTYLLDGAHTPQSMRRVVSWFGEETAAAADARACLLFNTTDGRDPVPLFQQLSRLAVQDVIFVPPKYHGSSLSLPSAEHLLAQHGIACIAEEVEEAEEAGKEEGKKPDTHGLYWQHTLRRVWLSIAAAAEEAEEAKETEERREVTTSVFVAPSIAAGLQQATELAAGEACQVLITGSLHLVGDALSELRWTDDGPVREEEDDE
eukprot:PLAT3893.1.p1 GENE.PLAT3893.1~~PLAT3893.1.p1  ORF type:complete len:531 (-),score=175.20 PLAT3893.1:176-1729(-)